MDVSTLDNMLYIRVKDSKVKKRNKVYHGIRLGVATS